MKTVEVVAAIIRKGDKIFATQRGYGDWKDYWEYPGGKVEMGETPEQALVREIREELDAEICVDKFLTTIEWDYPKFHLTMHCYICSLLTEALHLNEHEAARWLGADELHSVQWLPADYQLIPLIEREIRPSIRDLARVHAFIDSHIWHFAKTMQEIPHWYCLLKDQGDVEEFRWFAAYIREHSVPGQFYGKTYYYYYLDSFKYWWMDATVEECDLINRDIVDGETPIVFPHYSMIVTGSLERVLELFRQHNVPIQQSDFFADKGYVFMIRSGSENGRALVDALENSSDVTGLSSMYGQGIKEYIAFCKDSIIPVEIGFDL